MKRETEKQAERESGTRKDVEGMSKAEHHKHHQPSHEMGEWHEGEHHHDHHRGK